MTFFQVVFSVFVGAQGILFLIIHKFHLNDFRKVWLCFKWKKKTKTSVLRKNTLSQKMSQVKQIPSATLLSCHSQCSNHEEIGMGNENSADSSIVPPSNAETKIENPGYCQEEIYNSQ